MNFRWSVASILIACCLVQATSSALAETPVAPPTHVHVGGVDAFGYWFAKKLVLDLDETLRSQGIVSVSCTFRQKNPAQDFSYKGAGPCLYKDFIKSMKTDELAGVVYAWIQDRQGRLHPVEIQWRPPRGGWSVVIKQVLEMKFEKPLYYVREKIWGEKSSEKLRYTDFLAGELKIILPGDPEALAVLAERGGSWAKSYLANVESVDLNLKASENDKGKVVYSGALSLNHRADENESPETTTLKLRTNINVVVLKRPFFLQAKVRSAGQSDDAVPILGSEALP